MKYAILLYNHKLGIYSKEDLEKENIQINPHRVSKNLTDFLNDNSMSIFSFNNLNEAKYYKLEKRKLILMESIIYRSQCYEKSELEIRNINSIRDEIRKIIKIQLKIRKKYPYIFI